MLALETEAQSIEDSSIKKGVLLVVDGTDPELVREIMEADVAAMSERHEGNFAMFAAGGGFAPTMGIIGTVMGLVNVLNLTEFKAVLAKSPMDQAQAHGRNRVRDVAFRPQEQNPWVDNCRVGKGRFR